MSPDRRSLLPFLALLVGAPLLGAGCGAQREAKDLGALPAEEAPALAQGEGSVAAARGALRSADRAWKDVALMSFARFAHIAALLPDETVLVAGGQPPLMSPLTTTEVYSAKTNVWTRPATTLSSERRIPAAVQLSNGNVLVAGGLNSSGITLSSVDLYDWAAGKWSQVTPMMHGRFAFTATLLADETVLVAGIEAQTELYDPSKGPGGTWTATKTPMSVARLAHKATRLNDGSVLVAGGADPSKGTVLATFELYDPKSQTWSQPAQTMVDARRDPTATRLNNGKVLVTGGYGASGPLKSAEVYDPATMSWSKVASMSDARAFHTATLLPSGRVLVAGGDTNFIDSLSSVEVYDPVTDTWSPANPMTTLRHLHTATLLPDRSVLITGGRSTSGASTAVSSCELYKSLPDGASCDHADDCQSGACDAGVCGGKCQGVTCPAPAPCYQDGVCNPVTGACSYSLQGEGAACDGGNPCLKGTTCHGSQCTGGSPAADGTACGGGGESDLSSVCVSGACIQNKCLGKDCRALDACHGDGVCDPLSGACTYPEKPCGPPPDGVTPPPPVPEELRSCQSDSDCAGGAHRTCGAEHVCCDQACEGKCMSCRVPGSEGRCVPETNMDFKDDCEKPGYCRYTCVNGECAQAVGQVQCAPPACADPTHVVDKAYCPDEGACPTDQRAVFDCGRYACDPILGGCLKVCASVNDCAPPFVCDGDHHCVTAPGSTVGSEPACAFTPASPAGGGARGALAALALAALASARRRREGRAGA